MSGFLRVTWAMNLANDSSDTSHSRLTVKRAKHLVVTEREPVVVDPLGLHHAEPEVPEMVVVRGRDRQLEQAHAGLPLRGLIATSRAE